MLHVYAQNFYERLTGARHMISIGYEFDRYEVRLDCEFYATAESRLQAFDEVADIIRANNWAPIRPF